MVLSMLYAEICPKVERHASGRALCLLTLGHISAYNMDGQHNIIVIITLNVFGDFKK